VALVAYLLRTDLRRRWRGLMLLALLTAVVVGSVFGAEASARRTPKAVDRYLDRVQPLDALLLPESAGVTPRSIAGVKGVQAAVGFRWFLLQPVDDDGGFFPTFVPDDDRVPNEFLRYPLISGRAPHPSAPLEVALGEHTADRLGMRAGDRLDMVSYSSEQTADIDNADVSDSQGPDVTLDVVGIVRDPVDLAGRKTDIDITLLTPAFGKEYDGRVGELARPILLRLDPAVPRREVTDGLDQLGTYELDGMASRDQLAQQLRPTLDALSNGLHLTALVIALTGFVTLLQAMARGAAERAADHDALRSLGITRSTLLLRLGLPAMGAAVAGVAIGALASVAASPFLSVGVARRAEIGRSVHVDGAMVAVGALIALLVLAVAVVGTSALALHRERGSSTRTSRINGAASWAAGIGASVPVVTGLRLALDAGRGRRATPVRAAAGAVALGAVGVVATVVFGSSLHHAVTTPSVYGWGWDAMLIGVEGDQLSDGLVDEAALVDDPHFSTVAEIIVDLEVTVDGRRERAVALDDKVGHTSFVMVRGHEPRSVDEVAVGAGTLTELGRRIGDTIEVGAGGPTRHLQIVGVTALPVNEDGGSSTAGLAMTRATADSIGFNGSCDGDVACSRHYALAAAPGEDILAAAHAYTGDDQAAVALPSPPGDVARLTAVDGLPRYLAGLLGIIGVVAVSHAASATVRRRRLDLAQLRVVGFSGRQLRTTVAAQVTALAVGGGLLGAVAGLVVGRQAWTAVAGSASLPVVVRTPVLALVLVPIALLVVAHVGASWARHTAGQIRAGAVLRAE
jgi:hypothetical protein